MSIDHGLNSPTSARVVHAYGEPSPVSLSDEVAHISPERVTKFVTELQRLYEEEVAFILSEGDVRL